MDVFEEGLGRIMYVAGAKAIPCSVIQIPEPSPTRLHQKVTFLRGLHPEALVSTSSEGEALLVRSGAAPLRNLTTSRRASK